MRGKTVGLGVSKQENICLYARGHFSREPCLCLWPSKLRQEWVGKGRQAFTMVIMPWFSLPRSLCRAAKELPDVHRLWLLLHSLRSLLGPLIAHCKGTPHCNPGVGLGLRAPRAPLGALQGCDRDLDLFSLQRGYPEVTLMDCMRLFTKEDVLDGDEKPVSHPSVTEQPPS